MRLPDPGGEAGAWLASHGLAAVLLRPDRYVFAAAQDAAALGATSLRLPGAPQP